VAIGHWYNDYKTYNTKYINKGTSTDDNYNTNILNNIISKCNNTNSTNNNNISIKKYTKDVNFRNVAKVL
jgi:hypothetical protein